MLSNLILALAVGIPLLIYIRAVYKDIPTPDYRTFLNPQGAVSPAAFANASSAYNFQVASISFFIFLGFVSPLAAILNVLFWGAGIFWFRKYSNKLTPLFIGKYSLPAFLGDKFGDSRVRTGARQIALRGFSYHLSEPVPVSAFIDHPQVSHALCSVHTPSLSREFHPLLNHMTMGRLNRTRADHVAPAFILPVIHPRPIRIVVAEQFTLRFSAALTAAF